MGKRWRTLVATVDKALGDMGPAGRTIAAAAALVAMCMALDAIAGLIIRLVWGIS